MNHTAGVGAAVSLTKFEFRKSDRLGRSWPLWLFAPDQTVNDAGGPSDFGVFVTGDYTF